MPTQVFFETLMNEWNEIKDENENEEVEFFFFFKIIFFEEFEIIHKKSEVEPFECLGRKCCQKDRKH